MTRRNCAWCLVLIVLVLLPSVLCAEDPVAQAKVEDKQPSGGEELTGAAEQEEFVEEKPLADPLEPWNRVVFSFNDRLYFWLVKPVARGYSVVVPEWGRVRVRNAFQNITMPVRFVNSFLQLKLKAAGVELVRFLINSTVGIGGMFDVASQNPKLAAGDEDLGQTLGVYGLGEGFFIVWPVIGPSSARDSVGLAGDSFLNPVNYITPFEPWLAVRSYEHVNGASLKIGEYEDLKESAVDPYIALKDAYSEHRRNKVKE